MFRATMSAEAVVIKVIRIFSLSINRVGKITDFGHQ